MARNSAGSTRGHTTTVVTGRRQGTTRLTATFVALLVGVGTIALAVPPTPADATGPTLGTQTLTFAYTGAPTSFTVPPGVTSATFSVSGAQGGTPEHDIGSPVSGLGGEAVDTMTVTPGTVYSIYVGGQNGWNGGGGD